jgi:Uma2 family endonuclease
MTGDAFVSWMETWRDIDKWELHEGYPVAMAGGTAGHDTIAINLTAALLPLRKRGCRPHRDILLRSPANDGFGVFPDVYVRCGPSNDRRNWLDDAVAVFEVLSSSTMRIDRGYKSEQYRLFPTLKHICIVYQNEARLEMWSRDDAGEWIDEPTILRSVGETLHLSAFDLDIPMAEIYADTELAASATAAAPAAGG